MPFRRSGSLRSLWQRNRIALRLLGLALASLASGCAAPIGFQDANQRTAALASFHAGQAQITCPSGQICLLNWIHARPVASRMMQAQHWDDLADVVLASGYDQDLTWFYLGLAASGLGYNDAARTYLSRSEQRSIVGGLQSCVPDNCDGINLPNDAAVLVASLPATGPGQPLQSRRVVQRRRPAKPTETAKAAQTPANAAPAVGNAGWVQPVGDPE